MEASCQLESLKIGCGGSLGEAAEVTKGDMADVLAEAILIRNETESAAVESSPEESQGDPARCSGVA